MTRSRPEALWLAVAAIVASVALAACGSAATGTPGAAVSSASGPSKPTRPSGSGAARLAHWAAFAHLRRPLDLAGPRSDGAIVLAAAGRLALLRRSGRVVPFARGGGYESPGGVEPYIALAPAARNSCFPRHTVYALRLRGGRGVVAISPRGRVHRFAGLSAPGLIDGIAFDRTGRFGHRLLVTINAGRRTTVEAIGCHGAVATITRDAPRVEGGIAVAPSTFGRYAGDLIAPDEKGGRIFAITPRGKSFLLARSGLPRGQDVGVESEAFVPRGRREDALLADRLTPGNRHPGDDVVLRIGGGALRTAGVRPGDLLVATEGGARTDAISCTPAGCRVRQVADGPPIAHAEGHIAFLRS